MPKCKNKKCGFQGRGDEFDVSLSAYHDLKCPKCGTTHLNTSDLNREEAVAGMTYGYGDDNSLRMK